VSPAGESWRIRAEIDHGALRHNAAAVRKAVGEKPGLIAVGKADGDGHGGELAVEVGRVGGEAARAARLPVFCYVQGMESMACVMWKDGGITKLGVQLFPG
jgi:hypothetical protein